MRRFLLLAFLMVFVQACSKSDAVAEDGNKKPITDDVVRGTWVTNVASNALSSRENIIQTVDKCQQSGLNTIFMVVWNKGNTLYPSHVMQSLCQIPIAPEYIGRDPLKEMIEAAHAKGLKVYAWFEYGFACSYNQNGGPILAAKPEWAAKDNMGKLLNKNGFEWMNPFLPEVQNFMISLVEEVVRNYEIDGVQGDDRMPALPIEGGYDTYTQNLYKEEHQGVTPSSLPLDTEWVNWRTDKLTAFQGKLYQAVKAIKPDVIVSTAPSIYPWSKQNYLQDWPSWLNKGYTDLVIPQHYRKTFSDYENLLKQQLSYLQGNSRSKFIPAMLIQNGLENPSEELLIQMIRLNRYYGIKGEGFWFFEGLNKFPNFFRDYKAGKYN